MIYPTLLPLQKKPKLVLKNVIINSGLDVEIEGNGSGLHTADDATHNHLIDNGIDKVHDKRLSERARVRATRNLR